MPKLLCKCGEALSYGDIPCRIKWRLIADTKFDSFSGQVDAEEVYAATEMFLRCPKCGRLWVFWEGAEVPQEYVPAGQESGVWS